ncbi:T9SS type A sorting domain-containing protein [bacterium]|nr:T9SS type A sorting domain-containing protein [bacterium]
MNKFSGLILYIFLGGVLSSQPLDERYHSYPEILSLIDSLSNIEEYQNILLVDTIGYSSLENIPIVAVKISDNVNIKEDEPRVLFVGQVHAEEVLGIEVILSLMNDLLDPRPEDYNHMNILKSYLEIWLIPSANPDGLGVVHEGLDLTFRKNKTDFSPGGPDPNGIFDFEPSIGNDVDGVDLNRNFGFNWTFGDTFLVFDETDYGSHYDYYRGPSPFSESEAVAIRDLALQHDFVFSIVWHSSRSGRLSEKVFTSWNWEGAKPSPDLDLMKGVADTFSGLMEKEDGTGSYLSVLSGSRNGKLHDWFYRETGCIQYLVECGTSNLQPDSLLIESTVNRTKPAMIYLMDRTIGYNTDAGQATGIIYDANTNAPIPGVEVKIEEHSGSVLKPRLTNEFGRYRRILDAGTYHLNISKKGYLPLRQSITANNSGITEANFSLIQAPLFSIRIDLDNGVTMNLPYEVKCFVISENDTDTLLLYDSHLDLTLAEGFYKLVIDPSIGAPWEKELYIDQNYNFVVPMSIPTNYYLSQSWNEWSADQDSWHIINDNLLTQSSIYYDNNDSLQRLQKIRSPLYDISGKNRVTFKMNHQYETEWDHDSVGVSIYDANENLLFRDGWSGHKWGNYVSNYFSITNNEGFDSLRLVLWFKTDQTVNYRGWDINSFTMYALDDAFLSVEESSSNTLPQINFNFQGVFPNPSFGKMSLDIQSWQGGSANVRVYNILGQQLYERKTEVLRAGSFFLNLDFKEFNDVPVSSGMLFVEIESNNQKVIRKCIILKN